MDRTALLPCFLLLVTVMAVTSASAGIYRWTDSEGKVHYGARPPAEAGSSNEVKIRNQAPASGPEPVDREQLRNRYLEQRQRERGEKKKKAEKEREQKMQRKKRCIHARNRLRAYRDSGALYERLPNSERRYLTDQERKREIAKARREVDRWCK